MYWKIIGHVVNRSYARKYTGLLKKATCFEAALVNLGVLNNILEKINKPDIIPFSWLEIPSWSGPPHCRRFEITLRSTTLGNTPLDE
jgi:hypothetical protein